VPGKAPSCAGAKLEAAAPSPLVGGVLRATKLDRGLISKFQNASLSLCDLWEYLSGRDAPLAEL